MGYGLNTQLIHGLYLDPQQSDLLRDGIRAWLKTDEGQAMKVHMSNDDDLFTLFEMMSDEDEETGIRVVMTSEDSNSISHDTTYDKGRWHGFGIVMADKGYGSCRPSGDFAKATKSGATEDQKAAYVERLGGILKCAGLDSIEPSPVIVSHMA